MNVESHRISKSKYLLCFLLYIGSACLFAIYSPQAQVVSLWPPAGVALVGCLLFGFRFLPALFVGSLLFNSGSAIWNNGALTPTVLEASGVIALGSITQAWANVWLLRYYRINILDAPSYKQVSLFIVIAGVCCLINALMGNAALAYFYSEAGQRQMDWVNLLTWWGGDFLGVILVAPLLLGLFTRKPDKSDSKHVWISLSLPLFIIISAFQVAQLYFGDSVVINTKNNFNLQAEALENNFKRDMDSYTQALDQLTVWVAQQKEVSKEEFFTRSRQLTEHLPGIKGISWNPLIEPDEVAAFEQTMQHAYPDFKIKGQPLLPTDPLVVVKYIQPLESNWEALGFNVYANPARKKSMQMAKKLRADVATDIIQLVQLEKNDPGFLIFSPVFQSVDPADDSMGGYDSLKGFVVGGFQVSAILESSLRLSVQKYMDLYVYEKGNPTDRVYGDTALLTAINAQQGLNHQFIMKHAQHEWTFNLHVPERVITALQVGDMLGFLAVQALFGILAVLITLSAFGYHERLSRLVDSRTDELKRVNDQLHHYAFYDSLTGLPNRRLFLDRLKQALELSQRNHSGVALLYMDLNGFKAVNDSLGHEQGDQLLIEVSRRFNHVLRHSDTLGRLGGDEFTLLLPNSPSQKDIMLIVNKLTGCLEEPIILGDSSLVIENSIGVAIFPQDGSNLVELMAAADTAMYAAKKQSETVCFYSQKLKAEAIAALDKHQTEA
ncbi:diguanylate cyclase [Amphritea opalescens]|uniref:Diguanylate cyclase n=1 Tax=Amphritea opalescens TaxID=2490544 RepID=A0A430KRL2_9GAMM|nr:diguanylate cyclase [Amphritea opalescens]RTE66151.1 diguanylate cyclase [Amphritea opalescens]